MQPHAYSDFYQQEIEQPLLLCIFEAFSQTLQHGPMHFYFTVINKNSVGADICLFQSPLDKVTIFVSVKWCMFLFLQSEGEEQIDLEICVEKICVTCHLVYAPLK